MLKSLMKHKRLLLIVSIFISIILIYFIIDYFQAKNRFQISMTYFSNYEHEKKGDLINAALVLEGGAMRSLYTAGVLDVFMENGINFTCVIGVSAGALTAGNYVVNHLGRSAKINILHSNDSNFFGLKQLLLKKNAVYQQETKWLLSRSP